MNRIKLLVLLLIFSNLVFAEATGSLEISRYELRSGDKIKISVYGEDDLMVETLINDNNIIRYPFLGDINIEGMTVGDLEQHITKKLNGDYIIDPNVYINVLEYRPFYIRGEVKSPGSYPYKPGLTVEKAISIAGGFTDHAAESKIFLIKENQVETELKVKKSDSISPGDVVTIKESYF